jgi:hypothetical protein
MGEKTTGTAAVFSKCIRKACDQTLLKIWWCWMHVLA